MSNVHHDAGNSMKATSVILGANRVDQLDATLAVVQFKMGADLKKRRDNLTVEFRHGDAVR
jgi:1-deoxyxylulose-5-phosphate synthase